MYATYSYVSAWQYREYVRIGPRAATSEQQRVGRIRALRPTLFRETLQKIRTEYRPKR